MMEFIELLKVDPKFRYILLTLAQEKRIKAERFPLIYADLVAIGHSNEVASVAFSPDGRRIVSGSVDETIKLIITPPCWVPLF
mgnify:CR=1 FL=1